MSKLGLSKDLRRPLAEWRARASVRLKTELGAALPKAKKSDEAFIAESLRLFNRLCDAEMEWRGEVFRGEREYDAKEEEQFFAALRELRDGWAKLLPWLAAWEAAGYKLKRLKELKDAYRSAKGMLTPDSEFFDPDVLQPLVDKAIDEHRAGLTVDLEDLFK